MKILVLIVLCLTVLSGCAITPRPARTTVTPGESEIRSEREERRPSESVMRIRSSTAKTPEAPIPQPLRIRIRISEEEDGR